VGGKEGVGEGVEELEEAVMAVFPGKEGGAEGLGEVRGGVMAMVLGLGDARSGEAEGVGNGDNESRDGGDGEGAVTEATIGGGEDGNMFGMVG
jgi:hypothetical protein